MYYLQFYMWIASIIVMRVILVKNIRELTSSMSNYLIT